MPGEEILGPLMELLYGAQVSPNEVYRRVGRLTPDERRDFVDSRVLNILSGSARMAGYELGPVAGMSIRDSEGRGGGLLITHLLNMSKALGAIVATRKSDISPVEIKPQVGSLDTKDQQAFSQVGRTVEWLQEEGEGTIKPRFTLQDFLFAFADVRNMRYLEQQVAVGEGAEFMTSESQRKGLSRGWENAVVRAILRRIGYPNLGSLGYPIPASAVESPLNAGEHLPFPRWTSLTLPLEETRSDVELVGVERISDLELAYQILFDALDPLITTAEALPGFWGYIGRIRQSADAFQHFPGLREVMSGEAYHELYSTAVHLCLPNFSTEAYPPHLLKILWRGVKPRILSLLQLAENDPRVKKYIQPCFEASYSSDPLALSSLVSSGNMDKAKQFLAGAPDLMRIREFAVVDDEEDEEGWRIDPTRRTEVTVGRPIGTQGVVARNLLNSADVDPFADIDFTRREHRIGCPCSVCGAARRRDSSYESRPVIVNVMEQAGITGELLREVVRRGDHIGKRGFETLMDYGLQDFFEYPYAPRYWRNWPHYLPSFEQTLQAVSKDAPEAAFGITIAERVFSGTEGDVKKHLRKKENVYDAKVIIEKSVYTDVVQGVFAALKGGEKAWRFANPADLALYLERGLMTIISGHFVYPTESVVDTPALTEMRREFPSAGLILNVDWRNFAKRRGLEIRPKRLDPSLVEDSSLGELEAGGVYPMVTGSNYDGRERRYVAEESMISPTGELLYQMVDNVSFFRQWSHAVSELMRVDRNISDVKYKGRFELAEVNQERWFSPAFLYGDIAIPGVLWKILADMLETPANKGGLQFLQGAHLNSVRRFIELAERAGLLRPHFTFVHPRYLGIKQQVTAEAEMVKKNRNVGSLISRTIAEGTPSHVDASSTTAPWS